MRIRNQRPKPIDLLAINLRLAESDGEIEEEGLEVELNEPYELFKGLTEKDMQELNQDIQMYIQLETNEKNLEFWKVELH